MLRPPFTRGRSGPVASARRVPSTEQFEQLPLELRIRVQDCADPQSACYTTIIPANKSAIKSLSGYRGGSLGVSCRPPRHSFAVPFAMAVGCACPELLPPCPLGATGCWRVHVASLPIAFSLQHARPFHVPTSLPGGTWRATITDATKSPPAPKLFTNITSTINCCQKKRIP